jgi:hypothetical protein
MRRAFRERSRESSIGTAVEEQGTQFLRSVQSGYLRHHDGVITGLVFEFDARFDAGDGALDQRGAVDCWPPSHAVELVSVADSELCTHVVLVVRPGC